MFFQSKATAVRARVSRQGFQDDCRVPSLLDFESCFAVIYRGKSFVIEK